MLGFFAEMNLENRPTNHEEVLLIRRLGREREEFGDPHIDARKDKLRWRYIWANEDPGVLIFPVGNSDTRYCFRRYSDKSVQLTCMSKTNERIKLNWNLFFKCEPTGGGGTSKAPVGTLENLMVQSGAILPAYLPRRVRASLRARKFFATYHFDVIGGRLNLGFIRPDGMMDWSKKRMTIVRLQERFSCPIARLVRLNGTRVACHILGWDSTIR